MIGNAAMHKPFGIENGLGCAAQAVLICGYYIVRQKFLQAKRASFPHRQWTLWKTKKKKTKKTNTKKKTNCGGDNRNNNSNSQGSTRATTIRTTTGNYQTTAGFVPSLAAAESRQPENGAQRQPQTELQAQRNNEPVSTIRHSGESAKAAKWIFD